MYMINTLSSWLEVGLLVGLLYAPVTLGLSWSFRLMNYPDLTCEGTFIFSGALSIAILNSTGNIFLSVLTGIIIGAIAGAVTAIIHVYFRVSRLLSGIVTWAVLYSVTIHLLGGVSNLAAKHPTLFVALNPNNSSRTELFIAVMTILVLGAIYATISQSRWGRVMRAFGDQPWFAISLGFSPNSLTIIGLTISNMFIAAGGVLLCQFRGVSDVNMGVGVLIAGLASLVLGEAIVGSRRVWQHMLTVVAGTILYNLAIGAFYFDWGVGLGKMLLPSDVRMVGGFLLLIPAAIVARRLGRYKLFSSDW